jgi:hypothetical protein
MKSSYGQKQPHPSKKWTTAQKRKQLAAIRLTTPPHFCVITRTHEKLPTVAYLVPELDYGITSSEVVRWLEASGFPVPALRFKVDAKVTKKGYTIRSKPQISAGILRREAVQDWARVPNIQQLWFPPVWAASGYPLHDLGHILFQQAKRKAVREEFVSCRTLDDVLSDQQKIFIAIVALHAAWAHLEIPKVECAKHITQLRLKTDLEPKNFSNYSVEAGWGRMGDSQVERLWAKVITASLRTERFREELRATRQRDLDRFAKTHRANPFLFSVLNEFRGT